MITLLTTSTRPHVELVEPTIADLELGWAWGDRVSLKNSQIRFWDISGRFLGNY